jgi:Tol biopolymer transport system component
MSFAVRSYALWLLAALLSPLPLPASQVELVSVAEPTLLADSGGAESAVGGFTARTVSSDGRFSVFTSTAANLVAGQVDGNGGSDVFLYDHTAGTVTLVSHAAAGAATAGNGTSDQPAISADGSRVAFLSTASNLITGQVEGGAFGSPDVFLWDRATGGITLVSHTAASAVTTANQPSDGPLRLSDDGSWLAFVGGATNLVPGQVGPVGESGNIFLYDRSAGTNALVSHDAAAAAGVANGFSEWPVMSADGRYVAFHSSADNLAAGYVGTGGLNMNVYLWDRTTGDCTLVSHTAGQPTRGGASSQFASISADGRYVVYQSGATDLVAGVTDSNVVTDSFVYDRDTGANQLLDFPAGSPATTPARGADSPVISADGAWIVFLSAATNLVAGQSGTNLFRNVFLTERATGNTVLVSHVAGSPTTVAGGSHDLPTMSDDGRWLAYDSPASDLAAGDTNGFVDVFLYDRTTGANAVASHAAGSAASADSISLTPTVSGDGSAVVYMSDAANLDGNVTDTNGARDVFRLDRAAGTNALLSRRTAGLPSLTAGGASSITDFPAPTVSRDGRWVAFTSSAPNLAPGQVDSNNDNDVFLRDRRTGTTILVSRSAASAAAAGNRLSTGPSVSSDGRYVAYVSLATDLVAGQTDSNNASDIFLFDRVTGVTSLVSHVSASAVTTGNKASDYPSIAPDGSRVGFHSQATNLITGVTESNAFNDVFLYDRAAGTLALVSHTAASPLTTGNQDSSGPLLLGDGSVLFLSTASNLVAGQTDTNGSSDLFLYTPATDSSILVSHVSGAPAGAGSNAVVGFTANRGDNRWIAFSSRATNLLPGITDANSVAPDVFLFDRATGTTSLISHAAASAIQTASGGSWIGDLSDDGRWIAYTSSATDLVSSQVDSNGLDDVFLTDRTTGETILVTHVPGSPATAACCTAGAFSPRLSADGFTLAYYSFYGNLVSEQVTPDVGVFVYDRAANASAVASHALTSPTRTGDAESNVVAVSADGSAVVFAGAASDLVPGDLNARQDVFVYRNGQPGSYYTLTPCRLLDTRTPADGPALFSGQTAVAVLHGACGIPETAKAVALNVTAVQATGAGHLTVHPGDIAPPAISTLNFAAGQTRANNAVQRLALNGAGTLAVTPFVAGDGTVDVIVDVVGYFE